MDNPTRIATMTATFGNRLDGEPEISGGWIVWSTGTSEQTLAKFVQRAKDAGVPGVFAKRGRVGCRAE